MTAVSREPFHSAEEVAAWLGVTPATVREWARAGVIRGHRPGGRVWLFRASEVEEDIAQTQQRVLTQPEPVVPIRRRPAVVSVEPVVSLRQKLREGTLGR